MRCFTKFVGVGIMGLLLLSLGLRVSVAMAAEEEGFHAIFDGQTLEGWDGNPKFWRVEDGTITGQTTAGESGQGQHVPDLARRQAGRFRVEG